MTKSSKNHRNQKEGKTEQENCAHHHKKREKHNKKNGKENKEKGEGREYKKGDEKSSLKTEKRRQ